MLHHKQYLIIGNLYEYYYQQSSLNTSFQFKPKEKDQNLIEKFLSILSATYVIEGLGLDFFSDYFQFQLRYWDGKKTRFGEGVIMLSWIIGDKAIKRWEKAKDEHIRWQNHLYIQNSGVRSHQKDIKVDNSFLINFNEIEERDKKMFLNTKKGLTWCLLNTTLFNHKSPTCLLCESQMQCISLLEKKYPSLFKMRQSNIE